MFARLRRFWFGLPVASRVAVLVWVVLLGGIGGRVLVSKPTSQTVVPIYLTAGHRWIAGEDLYAPAPDQDVYRNPPGVAAGFAALTPLPDQLAGVVWRMLGSAVVLTGLFRLRRDFAPDLAPLQTAVLFLLAAGLVLPAINNGQVNLLLAGSILHGSSAAQRGRYWEAALWFGLGGGLKVYPLAAGLLVALVHPLRFAPKLLAVLVAGGLAPFLFQDSEYVLEQYRNYFEYLGTDDRTYATLYRVPRDWTVIPRVWLNVTVSPDAIKIVDLLAALVAAGVVGGTALTTYDRRSALGRALVLGSVWMTAFGPATEANTYAILAGPAAWVAVATAGRARWIAGAGVTLLLMTIFRGLFPHDWQFQILGPQALGAVLIGVAGMTVGSSVPVSATTVVSTRWVDSQRIRRTPINAPTPLPVRRVPTDH